MFFLPRPDPAGCAAERRPGLVSVRRWLGAQASRWVAGTTRLARFGPRLYAESALMRTRASFAASVADLEAPRRAELLRRIHAAGSLRDLWHLRPDIFALVSRLRDQAEAQARLARLNRHFPTRSPRSGFGAFDPKPPQ
ncbi:MAG: hypothetical protein ABIX46_13160 [Burkholderiaceae bacterium]